MINNLFFKSICQLVLIQFLLIFQYLSNTENDHVMKGRSQPEGPSNFSNPPLTDFQPKFSIPANFLDLIQTDPQMKQKFNSYTNFYSKKIEDNLSKDFIFFKQESSNQNCK